VNDDEFESFLRRAMHARPEPAAAPDLARRSMNIVLSDSVRTAPHLERITRHQRWNRVVGLAAAALVAIVIALGAVRVSHQTGTSIFSSSDSTSVSSASTDSSSSGSDTFTIQSSTLLTAELLVAALVLLSAAGPMLARPGAADLVMN
jgi:hypothetical protein